MGFIFMLLFVVAAGLGILSFLTAGVAILGMGLSFLGPFGILFLLWVFLRKR